MIIQKKLNFKKKINKKIFIILGILLLTTGVVYASGIILFGEESNQGLVVHYPLDGDNYNSVTTRVTDKTPYLNHGTSSGSPTLTIDRLGHADKAMNFDGLNDKIDLSYGAGINPSTNPITFSMWVKSNSPASNVMFLSSSQSPDSNARMYLSQYNGKWDLGIYTTSWGSGTLPVTTDWTYITLVMNGTSANYYINGNLYLQRGYSSYTFNQNLDIGNHDGTYFFNGSISDVRIYNRALSEREIKSLYNNYKPSINTGTLQKGLVAHYPLDKDSDGSGNNLVTNGDFEDGTTGWTAYSDWSTIESDSSVYYRGAKSLKVISSPSYSGYVSQSEVLFTVGKTYKFTARVKSTAGTAFRFVAGGSDVITSIPTTPGVWTNVQGYWTATSASTSLGFQTYTPGDTFWIDDYSVVEVTTKDKTPYSNNGIVYGATLSTDRLGHANKSMNFDGINDKIITGNFQFTQECSYSIWYKSPEARAQFLLDQRASEQGIQMLYTAADGAIQVYDSGGGSIGANSWNLPVGTFKFDNLWHQIIVTGNSSEKRFYQDGILVETNAIGWGALRNNPIFIGSRHTSSSYYLGNLTDLKIYNKVLSSDEIKTLYNSYNPKVSSGSLQKGLVLDLPLNNQSYNSATLRVTDKTPYSNHGTVSGGAIVGSDGTYFDALNDYVNCGNDTSLNPTVAETLSLWVNLNQIPSEQVSAYPQMIGKRDVDLQRAYFLSFQKSVNKIYWELKDNAGTYFTLSSNKNSWNAGQWYHIVAMFDSSLASSNTKIYVDGILDNSGTWNLAYIPQTSATARIGGGNYYLNGSISNFKLWNRALSAEEIKLLYNRGRN